MNNREEYNRIRAELIASGKKDSQLPTASGLNGAEMVPIVQDGNNRLVSLSSLLGFVSGGVVSINDMNLSLPEAIKRVPVESRKPGVMITYYDKTAKDWVISQYKGFTAHQWEDIALWGSVSNGTAVQAKLVKESELNSKYKNAEEGSFAAVRDAKGRLHLWMKTCSGWERIDPNLDNKACKYAAIGSRDAKAYTLDCKPKSCNMNVPYRRGNNVYITNECGEEEFLYSVSDSFQEFTIDVVQADGGTLLVSHTGLVQEGTVVRVEAIPHDGKQVDYISDSVVGQLGSKPYVFTVKEDRTITARFTDIQADEYASYIDLSPLVGYDRLTSNLYFSVYKNGRSVAPDRVLVNGVEYNSTTIDFATVGSNNVEVVVEKDGNRWRKTFTAEVRQSPTAPTCPTQPAQPEPKPQETSGRLSFVGDNWRNVTVTPGNGTTGGGSEYVGRPSLNAVIEARDIDGFEFLGFTVNGQEQPASQRRLVFTNSIGTINVEPRYRRVTQSVFPYTVTANVIGGNGTLNTNSQVVNSENDVITFVAQPNPGYEVDPSSKLVYRHSDYPNTNIEVRFRLKSNRAYSNGEGYNGIDDTSVLVNPNECYIDGSGAATFSRVINANEIPFTGIANVSPAELANAVQVEFRPDKLTAVITYNCQLLQGRKPTVRLTDESGRTVDVNLSDFKQVAPTEPEKESIRFSDGNGYTVDSSSKTINVANQCYIGEVGNEYFDVSIPYTGDFKESMLEGFTADMVQVTHNEQTKTINMRFFCRVLNGFKDGVVKLTDWLGNVWRVVLGDYKQIEPPKPLKKYRVAIDVDNHNNISHFLVNSERYTNDVELEFEEGSTVRIVAYPKAETEEHSYSIVEVGNTQGNEYHIEDLTANANVPITTRRSERELFYPLHVNVDNVENIAGYTVNEEMAFESKTFNIRKGTQVRIEAQPKDATAEHRYSIVSVGGTQGNIHTIDSMTGAQTVKIVSNKEAIGEPQPPTPTNDKAYLVEVLGGGTVKNSGENSRGYEVGQALLIAPNQDFLRSQGTEYYEALDNEIVPAQEPNLRGFNTNYPVPKATDFQALIGGVYRTLDEEGRYDGEPYLHVETRDDATNYIFLQPTNYKVRVHDEGQDPGLPGGNTGGGDSNPDDEGGIEWDGRKPNEDERRRSIKEAISSLKFNWTSTQPNQNGEYEGNPVVEYALTTNDNRIVSIGDYPDVDFEYSIFLDGHRQDGQSELVERIMLSHPDGGTSPNWPVEFNTSHRLSVVAKAIFKDNGEEVPISDYHTYEKFW